ncbi:MAG TPA: peptidase MA family metallohydrolase [Anaerolineales bacterium]|nr:peptidase MA family metallohydrolase [Anaerolineales bacterium]
MRISIIAVLLSLSLLAVTSTPAYAQANVTENEVIFNFPESATFRATITGGSEIRSVVLEYGNEQETCGEVIAKAFPEFSPGTTVDAEWTWEMRQSGSLPPGAKLWWRWRVVDANGQETISETKTATWLDDNHNWKTINEGQINFHWYRGDEAFARDLLTAAQNGLEFNETQSGLTADSPIDIYIFADTNDLRDAILYEPSWTGGQAFPDQDIVILGISQSDLDWGRDAIVHELTHVLVGHLTFTCLGDVPTWLNEGLAVYSEGELDPNSQAQLDDAIQNDTLLSVRSLSSGFSEVPDRAYLSYSQSYSVVKHLIETHGQDEMTALLTSLRDGLTIDQALLQTYGFDVEGLEDEWRKAIGARPRTVAAQPTAQPTPTYVPTIVPVSVFQITGQSTPTAIPTSSFATQSPDDNPARTGPPLSLTLILLGFCCLFMLLVGVVVLGFIVRRDNTQAGKNE